MPPHDPENPQPTIDVWAVLARDRPTPAIVAPPAAPAPQPIPDVPIETAWSTFWKRAQPAVRHTLGCIVWAFVLIKLFVIDVDRIVLTHIAPSYIWALDYRSIGLIGAVLILSLFFWKWRVVGIVLYIAFYPLTIVFWTIPYLVIKKRIYKRWLVIFGSVNALTVLIKNFRYHVVSKSAAILAAAAILLSRSTTLLWANAAALLLILLWATGRVVVQTFRSNTFISAQRAAIELASRFTKNKITVDTLVKADGTLVPQQAEQFANNVQLAAITNRGLYLWAYRIQKYRESNLTFLFNLLSYVLLIFGAATTFTLINLAILKLAPAEYHFATYPSKMAMTLYGLSTMAVSDGGGVSAQGDVAMFLRILAGVYGPTFLLTALVNSVLAARSSRGDAELGDLVKELRRRAREHEEAFRAAVQVGIDEACERLLRLGLGSMLTFLGWIKAALPPEFIGEDPVGEQAS